MLKLMVGLGKYFSIDNRKKKADTLKRIFNRVKYDKKLDYGMDCKLNHLNLY
jgi:hypothetical protein